MSEFMYSGSIEIAEKELEAGNFGAARCQYQVCLDKTKKYEPTNIQKIDYLKRCIQNCRNKENNK